MTRRFNSFILLRLSSCRRQQPPNFGSERERERDRDKYRPPSVFMILDTLASSERTRGTLEGGGLVRGGI